MEVKMQKIRYGFIVLGMLLCPVTYAAAQVNIDIGLPTVSIGINLPLYPNLVPVPGYPVYYAPGVEANYFFYDGMYWVYQYDNWYASSWYNGPWSLVDAYDVPLYILRIPVSYYRLPPVYFRGWQSNAPPRWGEHWGHGWEQRRSGWDNWNRRSSPSRAPLPVYQRQYTGDRYPRAEQQQSLRSRNYHYQPRDAVVRTHFQPQADKKAPAPAQRGRQGEPQQGGPGHQQALPAAQHQQRGQQAPPVAQHQQRGQQAPPAAQHQQRGQQAPPAAQRQQREQREQQAPPAAQRQQREQQAPPAAQRQQREQQAPPAAQRQQREQQAPPAAQRQQREQQAPQSHGREESPNARGESQGSGQGHGQEQKNEEDHGRGR